MQLTRPRLARMIDHTLLAPTATEAEVAALVAEANELGTWSVCVSPSRLPLPGGAGRVRVAAVAGFPSGQHTAEIKADEATAAVAAGAHEIDMVIDVGRLLDGDLVYTEKEVRMVREAVPAPVLLKVILETGVLTDRQVIDACQACERAGADYVKTSTGFHPSGGATVHAVEVMRAAVGDRLGIKASGGIRDYPTAVAMVRAGATRLGMSASRTVLEQAPAE
ncbi:deoxyribose-phosphate aldolase [Raineyella antarctica]|uniref:Deoxyribose-phosphate aldolase n=1 Tax=Raineyella antarctica TaxID=1577474 RepID=A0A1G6H819_9ACTN|nr:deoxyribose-phosphate aldolase [Raineyella antarctica]SDB90402.1 deoxyribose-phosphate aldolase [Raineyella antarctica]